MLVVLLMYVLIEIFCLLSNFVKGVLMVILVSFVFVFLSCVLVVFMCESCFFNNDLVVVCECESLVRWFNWCFFLCRLIFNFLMVSFFFCVCNCMSF